MLRGMFGYTFRSYESPGQWEMAWQKFLGELQDPESFWESTARAAIALRCLAPRFAASFSFKGSESSKDLAGASLQSGPKILDVPASYAGSLCTLDIFFAGFFLHEKASLFLGLLPLVCCHLFRSAFASSAASKPDSRHNSCKCHISC